MSYAELHTVTVTTATGGGGTGYTPVVTGKVALVKYTAATGGLASTADFTVASEISAQTIWSQTNVAATTEHRPVVVPQLPSGVDSTISEVPIYVAQERISITVAQGGNTKTGIFTVIIA